MQGKRPDLDQRIQNAVFGLPLVRPDEQHRCLGTFYERIELRISFAEALKYNCSGLTAPFERKQQISIVNKWSA
ncbi:DUF1694 domain-containing protein [Lactiplantibacillus plantarum]|uniref:DUF1694 domain-containing protein n=1 Tax=Lactiplantibacillus plantarum TaxID=1590 RepID=UPI00240A31BB|nr:DUF1694 domain-containing protein [Lactiplantibacillus plantarum]